jgi:hypothetical protein
MTIKELRKVTKCHIFVERTDSDGAIRRTEWLGATRDYQISSLKIIHVDLLGFALAVELEEAGA